MPAITETLNIKGMTCGHCIKAVAHAIEVTPGVVAHDVEIGNAEVTYEPEFITREEIEAAIKGAGYTPGGWVADETAAGGASEGTGEREIV